MPTTKPRKRHRLEAFQCTEISACKVPVNQLCKMLVTKSKDAPAALDLARVDEDERWIFGVVAVSDVDGAPHFDSDDEHLPEAEMVQAANGFLRNFGGGKRSHKGSSDAIRFTQSAVLTAEVQSALGIDLGYTPWVAGGFVEDDTLWSDIKAGTFRGFSVGGTAIRVLLESEDEAPAQSVAKAATAGGARLLDDILREAGHDPAAMLVRKAKRAAPAGSPAARAGWRACGQCPGTDACRRAGACGMERRAAPVRKSTAERGRELARDAVRRRAVETSACAGRNREDAARDVGTKRAERIASGVSAVERTRQQIAARVTRR